MRTSRSTRQKEGTSGYNQKTSRLKNPSGLPGVQKIKASLRQTKRLLAKDNLAADVRVETERRLKALEADLAQAEVSRRERTMAIRYHKMKFFERQKVIRRINQLKKRLASADPVSKKELEIALLDQRINLNYILHYPRTKKYVSLFPSEFREASKSAESLIVNPETEEVRSKIWKEMEAGRLPLEPESGLGAAWRERTMATTLTNLQEGNEKSLRDSSSPRKVDRSLTALEDDEFFDVEHEEGDGADEVDDSE